MIANTKNVATYDVPPGPIGRVEGRKGFHYGALLHPSDDQWSGCECLRFGLP